MKRLKSSCNEVMVQLPSGVQIRVFKTGLSTKPPVAATGSLTLRLDNSRGTDGAR